MDAHEGREKNALKRDENGQVVYFLLKWSDRTRRRLRRRRGAVQLSNAHRSSLALLKLFYLLFLTPLEEKESRFFFATVFNKLSKQEHFENDTLRQLIESNKSESSARGTVPIFCFPLWTRIAPSESSL